MTTDQLNKALDIMNQAVSGHFAPGMKESIAYFTMLLLLLYAGFIWSLRVSENQ